MKKALAAIGLATFAMPFAAAFAQDTPPQVARHEIMEDIGDAMGVLGKMAKGETEYDADSAVTALGVMIDETPQFLTLFPEGSESGHDTRAKPAIWENPDDFEANGEELIAAAEAARGPAGDGLEALRGAIGPVGQSCRGCHETYRVPKN